MIINEPIKPSLARAIGAQTCFEQLHIVMGVSVVLGLDVIVTFKAIAGKNNSMYGVVRL